MLERMIMDESERAARERVAQWTQAGQEILGRVLPAMFDAQFHLEAKMQEAQGHSEALRRQLADLYNENTQLRARVRLLENENSILKGVPSGLSPSGQVA
jgi:predicted nuclease with TOPRIM domain